MLFADAVFIGIDPSAEPRPIQFAALDGNLRIVSVEAANLEEVLAFVAGQESAVVGVTSPQSLAGGLLDEAGYRRELGLPAESPTWRKWRVANYLLRSRNIRLTSVASQYRLAPEWVSTGFKIYKRLVALGFEYYRHGGSTPARALLEVPPHAGFSVLLGHQPLSKGSLEGRLQRQLVLYLEGLDIPNPMRSLEEITRHHLLQGQLPLHDLLEAKEIDALLAAYTSYLAAVKAGRVSQVGDPREGWITLPAAELKPWYR